MTTIMTPAENLIASKMEEAIEEGYDAGTALMRVSNLTGLPRKRILEVWVKYRAMQPAAA